MKNREDFIKQYELEKPMYEAWGNYVKNTIMNRLKSVFDDIDKVIKIPVNVRVKNTDSIVEKAFYRKAEKYKDPLNEITDKVGIRFVLMLKEQIEQVCSIVENSDKWNCSKDLDFVHEQETKPELFEYQSVHYIVRNTNEFEQDNILIKKNIACEIQIRTLEQHAYAELSHDYIYKNEGNIKPLIKRYLARSIALNEAADELFSEVHKLIESEKKEYVKFTKAFCNLYSFRDYNGKINEDIFDNLLPFVTKYNISANDVESFVISHNFLLQKISDRQDKILFKQPMIFLIYYLSKKYGRELLDEWYLTENELEIIYSDLGVTYDQD